MFKQTDCTTGMEALSWIIGDPAPRFALPGFRLVPTCPGLPPVRQGIVPDGTFERSVSVDGCGSVFVYRCAGMRLALAPALLPDDASASPAAQLASVFGHMVALLDAAGIRPGQICRTWYYLDGILTWYDGFNRARDAFFRRLGIEGGPLPASTGIGCGNVAGAAVTMGFMAVLPDDDRGGCGWMPVDSPLQGPASDYRSSFSRAAEIVCGDGRLLTISGTASIAPDGKTQFAGDPLRQIGRTMEVVEALLKSRGMGWGDLCRTLVYLKRPGLLCFWREWLVRNGLPQDFAPVMAADVCRDDLLFEIEADACLGGLARE